MRKQGFNSIDELILPEKDRFSKWVWGDYSDERLVEYVLTIYKLFLQEYKIIIDSNFGSIKDYFKLYSKMPIKCFIMLQKGSEHCWLNVNICNNNDSEHNEIVSVKRDELTLDYDAWKIIYLGKEYDLFESLSLDISALLFAGVRNHLNVNVSRELTPIRNLVYEKIKSEIDGLINYLFKKYHVDIA